MLFGSGRHPWRAALAAVALAAVAMPAYAQIGRIQGSAQIEGKVTDEEGRPVGGAVVEVSVRARRLTAATDENGDYSFPTLPGGVYTVIVSKPGLGTARTQGRLRVPFSETVNVTLKRPAADTEGRCAGGADAQTLDEKVVVAFSAIAISKLQPRPAVPGLRRLLQWLVLADHHRPGCADVAATTIAGWSRQDLDTLVGDLAELSTYLERIRELERDGRDPLIRIRLHEQVLTRVDVEKVFRGNETLKRGAVLHADIGVLIGDDLGRHPVLVADGRQQGQVRGTVHFGIGRRLLDSLMPNPGADADALLWYRAISAYLLRSSRLNEAPAHLDKARDVFPALSVFLIDSAYLHEKLASPAVQAAAQEMRDMDIDVGVDARRVELERAERFWRQALDLTPDDSDARLRLGRTLGELGRHDDAAAELRRARDGERDRQRLYLTELFLGREEHRLGRLDEARRHFENASALYPSAQSPRMALSFLARQAGDRNTALRALQQVNAPSPSRTDPGDPFWSYHEHHMSDAQALMEQMWRIGAGK